jgi:hypothetical protein
MSIFNFFRANKTPKTTSEPANLETEVINSSKEINQNLFVDNEEPEKSSEDVPQLSPIEEFLNQNFEWIGYNDGYFYPDNEYYENKLKLIRSNFRLAIDKSLDIKRGEIGHLRLHIIKTKGISSRLESQLIEKEKSLLACIHELDTQKVLSVENEGIVASSIHSYRAGFIRGVERFQQEKLLCGNTGLFN